MSLSFVSTGRLLSVCIYYHVRVLQGVIWWHIELYKPTDIELYWVSSPQHLTANKNVNTTSFFLILPFPLSFSIHRAMFCPDLYSFIIFFNTDFCGLLRWVDPLNSMFVEVQYLLKLSIDRTVVDDLCILKTKILY